MRKTVISLIGAIALVVPAAAGAQASQDDPRVRSRIVIDQQRERPSPRVIVQRRDGREEQREAFRKTVKVGGNGELHVSNVTGDITIARGGGNDATIEVTKVARARTVEEALFHLSLVKVEINERGNRGEVRAVYPAYDLVMQARRNLNVSVHFAITAPAGTRISARSVTGNLSATEITGDLSLVTTSGNVQVVKGKRLSAAKSTSGSVAISDTDSDIALEAGSISGDILLHRVKAPRLEVSTISGKVVMQDVVCERIEAQSLSGDVEFGGQLVKAGRYEFNSHSGNVRVAVGGGTGFEVEANSWSGNVQSELPMSNTLHQTAGRGPRRKELRGVVGDGSAVLEITTFSGNVFLTKR